MSQLCVFVKLARNQSWVNLLFSVPQGLILHPILDSFFPILFDWLPEWLDWTVWMVDWLTGKLLNLLTDWLTFWMVDRWTDRLTDICCCKCNCSFLLFFSKLPVQFSLSIKQQIVNMLVNYNAKFVIILLVSTPCFWLRLLT